MAIADKVKKLIKSRAFLFKLVLTIFAFICIPLLILQIFVIGRYTGQFQKNNQEYYLSVLHAGSNNFDSRQQVLSQTSLRISLNEDIRKPLRRSAENYDWYVAGEALKNYGLEVPHVVNVGVYYKTVGYILTNVSGNPTKYTLADYCQRIALEDALAAEQMEAFFLELDGLRYYATSDGESLYAAHPISLGAAGRNDAVAFYVMDAKMLEKSYQASVALQSSFAIVDAKGQVLIKGEDFVQSISEQDLNNFLSSGNSVYTVKAEKELLLYKYTDPESECTFLLSVDKDESQEQIVEFARMVRISMYVMLILMSIALAVTIYINYLPIHQLLKKHTDDERGKDFHSEIERLDAAFFELDKKTTTQKDLLIDFILGDLLFDNTVKPELVDQYFPAGSYQAFAVATAMCPALTANQSRQLANELTETTGHDIYVTGVPSRPHQVIICLGKNTIEPELLHDQIADAIAAIFGEGSPIYVGDVVTDIGDLRSSYRSAVTADICAMRTEPGVNSDELNKKLQVLSQCVYVGDKEEALIQLKKIKTFLYNKVMGEGHRRYCCFKLLNSYLTSINSNASNPSAQEVELLFSFTGLDHLFVLLTESVHRTCNQVADNEQITDIQMQRRLQEFVDEHFKNKDLCLTIAANYLKTSIYAVSRLFKETTGKGFKDYVTEKRLEYGHTLLCTTEKSIAEISAESGFENANYFSTIFKQKYGMPPTKYRTLEKEQLSNK